MFASTDDGHTWEPRDTGITEWDVYSLAHARLSRGPRILAGTDPAHLFYSDNLGRHWSELTALRSGDTSRWTFPAPPNIAPTKHIAIHPSDPETWFVGIAGRPAPDQRCGPDGQVIPAWTRACTAP